MLITNVHSRMYFTFIYS